MSSRIIAVDTILLSDYLSFSLCSLRVLCVSAVKTIDEFHRRDAENADMGAEKQQYDTT